MFAKTIIDSDAFLDMPLSTQSLYFHLSMRADDDGFINNPKKIQRMVGCGDDDLKLLMAKRFILVFDSGVIVIKHWKIHNYIRNDRYKPTLYQEEKAELAEKNSKAYTFKTEVIESENHLGIPDDNRMGYQMDTQVRLGKDRLVKDKKKNSVEP
ncbi:DNA replication protein, partial [Enterococcus faecalis]|nr:DNA replication protein [Enterococcus faecalis]